MRRDFEESDSLHDGGVVALTKLCALYGDSRLDSGNLGESEDEDESRMSRSLAIGVVFSSVSLSPAELESVSPKCLEVGNRAESVEIPAMLTRHLRF